jgi:hypothetical protein
MPRPRKNDPTPLIRPILDDFARAIAGAVERLTMERVRAVLDGASNGRRHSGRKRARILCYYPGCKNTAAPRFGMFCAAEHKNISATEKKKYRAEREAKEKS